MTPNEPRAHHYAPQFLLRNFACDEEGKKVDAVMKHGSRAVWARRSIESIGFEQDLYVHMNGGVPVSVERAINRRIETPISQSDTWAKIASGRTDALDRSDKPILYALIRHLEARTPHYRETFNELASMAALPDSSVPFSDEEQAMYAAIRREPELKDELFSHMASSLAWTESSFRGSGMSILRSPIPLRSSTTPVMSIKAPAHPALKLPLPGMVPFQLVMTLNPSTAVTLVLADFDDGFNNQLVPVDVALGLNRNRLAHFTYFRHITHLLAGRHGLTDDMKWAGYTVEDESDRRIVFRR